MDEDNLLEDVTSQLRACLISTKGRCDLRQIRNDYRMLMGCDIPYLKLGFKTLEDFIHSIPSLTTMYVNGQLLVDAKLLDTSRHIVQLVQKQKTKKRASISRPPERQRLPRWRPKTINTSWKRTYQHSSRPATVIHSQFVDQPHSKLTTTHKISDRLDVRKDVQEIQPEMKLESRHVNNSQNTKNIGTIPKRTVPNSLFTKAKQRMRQAIASLDNDDDDGDDHLNNSYARSSNSAPTTSDIVFDMENAFNFPSNIIHRNSLGSNSTVSVTDFTTTATATATWKENKKLREDFVYTGDYIQDLIFFTTLYNLNPPEIKVITAKTKPHKPVLFHCKIKVDNYSYSSYPEDFDNEEVVKQTVAKKALDDLTVKLKKHESLLISHDSDILKRIPPIVKRHPCGLWSGQLEQDYIEMFNEELPVNWIEILNSSECIFVVPTNDNRSILHYRGPNENRDISQSIVPNISVASNMVKFNDDNTLTAEITCVASAAEIWCRQRNTTESDDFFKMIEELQVYYDNNEAFQKATNIEIGVYYVAKYDQTWCRVRVFEIDNDNIHCFCIDFGDEWAVSKNCMYQLQSQFAKVPAQAFVCRLVGVEELYEASKSSDYLNSLLWKMVEVQLDENDNSDPTDPSIPVVLYDLESNVYVNQEVISYISIELATPTLELNTPTEVYVTSAMEDGSVFIQIRSKGYEQLKKLLKETRQQIIDDQLEHIVEVTPENDNNRLYFVQYNGYWYRTKITDWSPTRRHAQLFFVDYGNTAIVIIKNYVLYPLDELSNVINQFPYQALKVQMSVEVVPSDFVNKITTLIPPDQPVLVKAISKNLEDDVYLVELFKRSETDNILFSVNTAISVENELKNLASDTNNNANKSHSTKLQRLISLNQFDDCTKLVPSTGSLSCPTIPEIGNYLDVKIPCAVHPYNFFVQPYESQDKLIKLMLALQKKYQDFTYSPLQIQDVLPGKIYASRHEDGMWYRTSVIKVIHVGSISVFYCDFGYYTNLTIDQLVPLDLEFMDLPHQAIKAKLAGIQPKSSNWSMNDCKFFEKLVCGKSFVSIIMAIEKDVLHRSDTVLNLKLIDTSTKIDIYVDEVLINEGIAVSLN